MLAVDVLDPTFVAAYTVGFAVLVAAVVWLVRWEFKGIARPDTGDTITDIFKWAQRRHPWVTWVAAVLMFAGFGFTVFAWVWLFGHWVLDAW